jgi:HEAT repeat protein
VPSLPRADVAADLIQHGGDRDVQNLWTLIQDAEEPDARPLIEELARHKDPVVRGWALSAIGVSIQDAGLGMLTAHAKGDRDSDVRAIAIEELLKLDRREALKLAPAFRRALRSRDIYEPVRAMWALGEVGDTSSLEAIREIRESGRVEFHRKVATVVAMLLEGRAAEILTAIRNHDHDLMPWLTRAAAILGTPEAQSTLEACASGAYDQECKDRCRREAENLARRRESGR